MLRCCWSQAQSSLLAQLYLHPASEYSLTDLARLIGVSVKTIPLPVGPARRQEGQPVYASAT